MRANSGVNQYELICVIVNFGLGSKVISTAKQHGVPGGTVMLGRGTVQNRWLEILELTDIRKEIVVMIAEESLVHPVLEEISREFRLHKPNHGIAFNMPVGAYLGTGNYEYELNSEDGGVKPSMYNAVFVIVDKGKGGLVMDAAKEAGARGGTILNARGSGIHETTKFLNMEIEPEKEVVLILSENDLTKGIVTSVRDRLEIDKPGNGIIFVQSVAETYGIVNS